MKTFELKSFMAIIIVFFFNMQIVEGSTIKLALESWTVYANTDRSSLTIEHEKLGVVAREIQLYIQRGEKRQKLTDWVAEIKGERVIIHTKEPSTYWYFYIRNPTIGVTTTASAGTITAIVPADEGRFPARMMDITGRSKPVAWMGTDEVVVSYGGQKTKNLSFLPEKNSDVLYLSLGQVSSRNMHCLFDRKSDTMIEFCDNTLMKRDETDPDRMEITIGFGTPEHGSGSRDIELLRVYPDYYTEILGLPVYKPFNDRNFSDPPVIWNSWTSYYQHVTEKDVVEIADWIADNLSPYGLKYLVIDDGPERGEKGEHYWISNWNKETFPHGSQWIAEYIKLKGLKPGLWVVPNAYAGAVKDHPEWYLHDKDGKPVLDYDTPALDCTNPEVLDFLTHLFTVLKGWGFEYYKFDGEFALTEYIPNVDRTRLYDNAISPLEAYYRRLKVIREAVGEHTFLEGCPAGTPLQGIGYFNSYFNGGDIYNSWLGMYVFFNSINANLFLNHIVCFIMPGEGICVGPKLNIEEAKSVYVPRVLRVASSREMNLTSMGTTISEARTVATFASLCGTPYSFADKLEELPVERIDLLKKTLPALPIVPMDLFSRGGYSTWGLFREFTPETYKHNFPRIMDLKINRPSGKYDVVATTNWKDESISRSISFESMLGLDPQKSYLIFDFWNQQFLGVYKNEIELDIEPHDTRVLHVRPLLQRPQVLATNRHISGAYSIESLKWNEKKQILSGLSKTIANVSYSLFIYFPNDFSPSRIKSSANLTFKRVDDNVLKVTMTGKEEIVNWTISFK